MATLSAQFQQQLATHPDGRYTVVVTLAPGIPETDNPLRRLAGSVDIQPMEGLEGFYKATLSGQAILHLNQDARVQSIEPDDLTFRALG